MKINLIFAWIWILFGFVAGAGMGLNFHRPDWLGGYSSHCRRLVRLGHISFFGLAIVNLLFYFTVIQFALANWQIHIAGWAFITGAATMPICCGIMAFWPKAQTLFAIPVGSLLVGAVFTLILLVQL